MTPKEVLDQRISPDLTKRWPQPILDAVITSIEDYHRQQVKSVDLADVGETLSRSEFQEVIKRDAIGFQENGQFEEVDFEQLELIASSIWDDYKIVER